MLRPSPLHVARYDIGGDEHLGWKDDDHFIRLDAPPWENGVETGARDRLSDARLLPSVRSSKIVCVGLNYRAHIAESLTVAPDAKPPEEPLLFLKPPSAVIGADEPICYPAGVTRLDPEAELAVVMGRRVRHVIAEDAPSYVAGLTALNDVSARNLQKQDGQWTRAKGFDTFAPLGPWVTVGLPAERLDVVCRVNGTVRQHGNTSDLLFPVARLVSFISYVMTLEPGDVIVTGTPAGVGLGRKVEPKYLRAGDVVTLGIEGLGEQKQKIIPFKM